MKQKFHSDAYLESVNSLIRALGGIAASKKPFDTVFPIVAMNATFFGSHLSSVIERTLLMCTPSERWQPEHSRHMKIPRFIDAQDGSARNNEATGS
jgi:hypothetical protein